MVVRVIVCLAVICAALDYHRSRAVKCLKSHFDYTFTECEGKLCTALHYVPSGHEPVWMYDCIADENAPDVCEYPDVRYEANFTDFGMVFKHLFKGCCSSDWCSNDTEALTMPQEYEDYLKTLNPSGSVEIFPSSSRPELEIGPTTSISPPHPPISVTLLPSVNQGVAGTTGTMVSQSRGVNGATSASDVATSTDKLATSRSEAAMPTCIVTSVSTSILTSTVLIQPSGQPSSGSSSGDMDYETLSFILIILVCFLVCVIIIMFVAMGVWWAIYYRKMQSLGAKFTEFKLQIE